jgi:hypothetical protein
MRCSANCWEKVRFPVKRFLRCWGLDVLWRTLAGWRERGDTAKGIRERIAYWLSDTPSHDTVLSIHHLTETGVKFGTPVGQWFGPNAVSLSIQ